MNRGNELLATWLSASYPDTARFVTGSRFRCARGVAKRSTAMLGGDLHARLLCLLQQERGSFGEGVACRAAMIPDGLGTGEPSVDAAVNQAYVHWLTTAVRLCTSANIADLDYGLACPEDPLGVRSAYDLRNCLVDRSRETVLAALGLVFPTEPACGNGVVEGDFEECDEGPENSDTHPNACRAICRLPACGDGVVDPVNMEECDDGNTLSGDGCTALCQSEFCGDLIVNNAPFEECDDANLDNGDGCTDQCTICGNQIVSGSEACDDGPNNSDTTPDACRADCSSPFCGDDVVDTNRGEACDDGFANSDTAPDACRSDCTAPRCGDGVVDGNEECDNGLENGEMKPCRSDCTGFAFRCTLTIRVSSSHSLGALGYRLEYANAQGEMVGSGTGVECRSLLLTGALSIASDDDDEKVLSGSVIAASGFPTPANLVECRFDTDQSTLSSSAFTLEISNATDPDFNTLHPDLVLDAISCSTE